MYASPGKHGFIEEKVDFQGTLIGKSSIRVDRVRVKLLQEWPRPKSVAVVTSVIGLAVFLTFHSKFSKDYSSFNNCYEEKV